MCIVHKTIPSDLVESGPSRKQWMAMRALWEWGGSSAGHKSPCCQSDRALQYQTNTIPRDDVMQHLCNTRTIMNYKNTVSTSMSTTMSNSMSATFFFFFSFFCRPPFWPPCRPPQCVFGTLWGLRDADRMEIRKYFLPTNGRIGQGRC